jgi:hypothetical protein
LISLHSAGRSYDRYREGGFSKRDVTRLLIGAFIPFGGIVNERWLQGRLTEAKVDAL